MSETVEIIVKPNVRINFDTITDFLNANGYTPISITGFDPGDGLELHLVFDEDQVPDTTRLERDIAKHDASKLSPKEQRLKDLNDSIKQDTVIGKPVVDDAATVAEYRQKAVAEIASLKRRVERLEALLGLDTDK